MYLTKYFTLITALVFAAILATSTIAAASPLLADYQYQGHHYRYKFHGHYYNHHEHKDGHDHYY